MKKIISKLMGGVLLFSLSMSLTSCEGALDDILGEWSRPTPGSSTGGAVAVTSIDLDADEMKLTVGDKGQLTAKVDPAGTAVTWSSDKEEIATVDANGMVTAVAVGTAIITAKAGDKTATCEVTVLPTLSTPLTVEAITAGTITVTSPQSGMQYSLNGGAKTAVSGDINVAAGEKVEFYGNGTTIKSYNGTTIVGGTADIKVYGNIMSLVDEEGFATNTELPAISTFKELFKDNAKLTDASGLLLPATTLKASCYWGMFSGCTGLTTVPEKLLPATTLADHCYRSMFENCTGLTTLPEKLLPATEMKSNCYSSMFNQCTGLTTLPEKLLPATVMATNCYAYMFKGCTGLTTLPEKLLPAETLANNCYQNMFYGCNKLTTAPALPVTTLADNCYYQMFNGCTKLTTAPKLPATELKQGCYYGMFENCTSLTAAYVRAAYTDTNNKCTNMFNGCTAAGTKTLHTTTASKGSWSSGVPGTWTVADDWN